MFQLTEEQLEVFENWNNNHRCELKDYSGPIGGRVTYLFTPTSLGMVIVVKCGCGEKIDLTNYEE